MSLLPPSLSSKCGNLTRLLSLCSYYNHALKAVEEGMTYSRVRDETSELAYRLSQQKFLLPSDGEEKVGGELEKLHEDILEKFTQLRE